MRGGVALVLGCLLWGAQSPARILNCREQVAQHTVYDYIVTGAGPGGGPLAARLAAAGHKVLLLDAGGFEQPLTSKVPALHAVASEDLPISLDYGATHFTDPELAKLDSKYDLRLGGVLYPRGEGIGGSGLVNAMITVLPHAGYFDSLGRQLGDPFWSDATFSKVWQQNIEDCHYRPLLRGAHRVGQCLGLSMLQNLGGHGFDGWLPTTQPRLSLAARILWRDPQLRKILLTTEAFNRGAPGGAIHYLRRLMSKFDPNDRRSLLRQEAGLVLTPLAIDPQGRRGGVRSFILKTESEHPENLHIATEALVNRIVFEGRRAVGVEVIARENALGAEDEPKGPETARFVVKARKEVIVSAGTFESPAILMRSGIGPEADLARLGVTPVAVNEFVGKNLHDRLEIGVIDEAAEKFAILEGAKFKPDPEDPHYREWLEKGQGLYATNGAVVAFTARSHPSLPMPNLFIFGLPAAFDGYKQNYSGGLTQNPKAFTWVVLVARTQNRAGVVTLSSTDPTVQPQINFKYFEQAELADEEALRAGFEIVRKLNASMPTGLFARELSPGVEVQSTRDILAWAKREAWGHHAVGTLALGKVLDTRFRVKGVEGVRVVDASVFPDIPGYFIVSAIYGISEMAAQRILAGE